MNYYIGKLIFKGIFMSGGDYDVLEIAKQMIESIQESELTNDETPYRINTSDIFNGYMNEAQKRYVTNVSQDFFVQNIGGGKDIKTHCLNNTLLVDVFNEFIDSINNKRSIKEFHFKIRKELRPSSVSEQWSSPKTKKPKNQE